MDIEKIALQLRLGEIDSIKVLGCKDVNHYIECFKLDGLDVKSTPIFDSDEIQVGCLFYCE